jgi:tRNA dimethylallyltransferase
MKKITVITGQTAAGKTKFALAVAQKEKGELISCDSRQAYKYLDLITGKDIGQAKFNHVVNINGFDIGYYPVNQTRIWLYDIVDPKEYFSSYDYKQCALYVIKKLLTEGKTPVIVGGTYFYLYHLLYEVESEKIPPDWSLRKELESKTIQKLQQILIDLSKDSFEKLNQSDRNNPRRLMRRIEIIRNSGLKPASFCRSAMAKINDAKTEIIGLRFKDKDSLRKAITNRVEERIKIGAFEEVDTLLQNSYSKADPGLKTIGYKQIIDHLQGKITKEEAIGEWINKELQYAKRQYTFMKQDPHIRWKVI